MTQGFDSAEPVSGSSVASQPVRFNFNAIATHHYGPTAPSDPQSAWAWVDNADPLNVKLKFYIEGVWYVVIQDLTAGAITPSGLGKYVHNESAPATTWNITHGLNTANPLIAVYDATNVFIIPDSVTVVDTNNVSVTFLVAQSGRAIIVG